MTTRTRQPRTPQLRLHAPSGRAVVTLTDCVTKQRRDFPLGAYGSHEAHAAYAEIIRDWLSRGRRLDLTPDKPKAASLIDAASKPAQGDSVARLVLDYAKHIDKRGGVKPEQIDEIKRAIRYARIAEHKIGVDKDGNDVMIQCGALSVAEFGPKALLSVRKAMMQARKRNGKPWARKTINERIGYVVKMFRWGVQNERAPMYLPEALRCVEPLKRGEFEVPEGKKRKPVPIAHINAIKPHVSPIVWAMIQVQLRMVARAKEVCLMRPIDIDMSGKVWIYRPASHKTEHHGHELEKFINADCQEYIRPLLTGRAVTDYLFSPAESYALLRAAQGETGRRDGQTETERKTDRTLGDYYKTSAYNRAIERACEKAKIPKWTTHQLRHAGYTQAKKQLGVQKALLLLGDKSARMDEVYDGRDREMAVDAAGELRIGGAA